MIKRAFRMEIRDCHSKFYDRRFGALQAGIRINKKIQWTRLL